MLRLSLFMVVLYSSFAVSAFYLPLYFQFRGLDTQEIGLAMAAGFDRFHYWTTFLGAR